MTTPGSTTTPLTESMSRDEASMTLMRTTLPDTSLNTSFGERTAASSATGSTTGGAEMGCAADGGAAGLLTFAGVPCKENQAIQMSSSVAAATVHLRRRKSSAR